MKGITKIFSLLFGGGEDERKRKERGYRNQWWRISWICILRGRFRKVFVKKKDNSRNGKYYSTRVKLAFNPCNTSRLTICIRRSPSNWEKIGKKIARREGNSSESLAGEKWKTN